MTVQARGGQRDFCVSRVLIQRVANTEPWHGGFSNSRDGGRNQTSRAKAVVVERHAGRF